MDKNSLDTDLKYLVLGSTGYEPIHSSEWEAVNLPNIVDYDVVIVDVRSLNEDKLPLISNERFKKFRYQFARLLKSNGSIIVLSDILKKDDRSGQFPSSASNYSWCPIKIGISSESGDSITIVKDYLPIYFQKVKNWPYYFFTKKDYFTSELKDTYYSKHEAEHRLETDVFIRNRYDKTIAGSFKIESQYAIESSNYLYGMQTDYEYTTSGEITFLPLIQEIIPKNAVSLILEELIGYQIKSEPPEWVTPIIVPETNNLENQIKNKEEEINQILNSIDILKSEISSLNSYRKLLYSSGFELEEIIKKCFQDLGSTITPAQYGQEEYILNYEGKEYLIEIKGVSKSASLTHLRQLTDYMLKYEEDTDNKCKGLLFVNTWKHIPPHERNTTKKIDFPDNVIIRAKQLNIALISSTKFFNVFCDFLEGKSKNTQIMSDIINTSGIVKFRSDN